jgi:hypothetical protein
MASATVADSWCGAAGTGALLARALNPCWADSGAAVTLLLLAIVATVLCRARAAAWAAVQPCPPSKRGLLGGETAFLIVCSLLVLMHAALGIAAALVARATPFHAALHAALAAAWLLAAASAYAAARAAHAPLLPLRPLLVVALCWYLYCVYSTLMLYMFSTLFPPTFMKSLIWACMMAVALTSLLLTLELKRVSYTLLAVARTAR